MRYASGKLCYRQGGDSQRRSKTKSGPVLAHVKAMLKHSITHGMHGKLCSCTSSQSSDVWKQKMASCWYFSSFTFSSATMDNPAFHFQTFLWNSLLVCQAIWIHFATDDNSFTEVPLPKWYGGEEVEESKGKREDFLSSLEFAGSKAFPCPCLGLMLYSGGCWSDPEDVQMSVGHQYCLQPHLGRCFSSQCIFTTCWKQPIYLWEL